jgi:hypothetical protein
MTGGRTETMKIILVNPMDETPRKRSSPAPRLESLRGKTVALLDISKPGGKSFLDAIDRLLKERYRVERVIRETKPTFTKPAPDETLRRLLSGLPNAVVEALAD